MLVNNSCERVVEREVSVEEGRALAKELGCEFAEVSARNCVNVERAVYGFVRMICEKRRLELQNMLRQGPQQRPQRGQSRRTTAGPGLRIFQSPSKGNV